MLTSSELLATIDGADREGAKGVSWLAANVDKAVVLEAFEMAGSPKARRILISLMGYMDNDKAVATLVVSLEDRDPDIRQLSADSLGKIVGYPPRRPEFRNVVLPVLRNRAVREELGWVRSTVLQSLGLLGDSQDRLVLQEALESNDPQIKRQASWGLKRLSDEPW